MFTARFKNLEIIHIDDERLNSFEGADEKKKEFSCPACGKPVIIRGGTGKIRRHFAHFRQTACNGRSESADHQNAKKFIAVWLQKHGYKPKIEFTIPGTGGRRADVFVLLNGKTVIIEIQKSSLSTEEFTQRKKDYAAAGHEVFWIGIKSSAEAFNKERITGIKTIRLRTFPYTHAFSFNPGTGLLYMDYGYVQFQTGTYLYTSKKVRMEEDPALSLFPDIFPSIPAFFLQKAEEEWRNTGRNKRLYPRFSYSRAEKSVLPYYFSHQLSLHYYPSLCFLPVFSITGVQTGAEVWQSWIHWKFLCKRKERVELSRISAAMVNAEDFHYYPMTDHPQNAVRRTLIHYFRLLESFHVLKQIYPGVYQVQQPLTVKKSMVQLLEDDKYIQNRIKEYFGYKNN